LLFTIRGKQIDITEAVKAYAEEKTAKLPRYYDNINHVEVMIDGNQGGKINVEIIARAEHNKIFIVSETGQDPCQCIDVAVRKLQRQLRRQKGKERDNKRTNVTELT
jgi:putative sigma-54 modulation protein